MKKAGYRPHFAGAVEAVASTGGTIMPPVMGATALLMAVMLNIACFKGIYRRNNTCSLILPGPVPPCACLCSSQRPYKDYRDQNTQLLEQEAKCYVSQVLVPDPGEID